MRNLKLLGIVTLIVGQLLGSFAHAAEMTAREKRVEILKKGNLKGIVYAGKDKPKAIIYVFTDLDCGYCRKLHHEIAKLNELGIQLNMLAMPRQGVGSPSYNKLVSVWCSKDPKETLEQAMEGG